MGHAGLHEPRAGQRTTSALDARTDVYSLAACCTRCWPASRRTPVPTAQAIIARRLTEPLPSVRTAPARCAGARRPGDPAGARPVRRRPVRHAGRVRPGASGAPSGFTPVPTPVAVSAPAAASPPALARGGPRRCRSALLIGGALFAWRRTHAGASRERRAQACSRCCRSTTWATRPTPTSPTASPTRCGASSPGRGSRGDRARQLATSTGTRPSAAGDRARARRRLPADGHGALGEGAGRREPGAGDARAGGREARARPAHPVAGIVRRVAHRRVPGPGRHRDHGGRCAGRGPGRQRAARPRSPADQSLAAYDAFLQGEAASQAMSVGDPTSLRRAIGFYERAVALDSLFALGLGPAVPCPDAPLLQRRSRPCVGRAGAARGGARPPAQADDPLVYRAFGAYYAIINPVNLDRALAEYERGLRLAPDNVVLLGALGVTESNLGRWDSAATLARARGAAGPALRQHCHSTGRRDDDASAVRPGRLRRRPGARARPDQSAGGVAQGDGCAGPGRARQRPGGDSRGCAQIDPARSFSYMAIFQDLYWVLDDDAQRQVLALPPSAFDDDRGTWGHRPGRALSSPGRPRPRPSTPTRRGSPLRSRAGQRQRTRSATRCSGWPWPIWDGRQTRCGKASERWSCSRSAGTRYSGPYYPLQLARIYLLVGEPEKAFDQLEPLLRMPYYLSPGWLRIDPTFTPLKGNPRFERLVAGK